MTDEKSGVDVWAVADASVVAGRKAVGEAREIPSEGADTANSGSGIIEDTDDTAENS